MQVLQAVKYNKYKQNRVSGDSVQCTGTADASCATKFVFDTARDRLRGWRLVLQLREKRK